MEKLKSHLYVLSGAYKKGFWMNERFNSDLIVMVSDYTDNKIKNSEIENSVCCIAYLKGDNFRIFGCLGTTIYFKSIREATVQEKSKFTKVMHSHNIQYALVAITRKFFNKPDEIEMQPHFKWIDNNGKVFVHEGKYITAEEARQLKVEKGQAVRISYDNGYSHWGTYTMGLQEFVDAIMKKDYIQTTDDSWSSRDCAYSLVIGSDKRESYVSNT